MTWAATILTIQPDMFPGPLGISLCGKALAESAWSLDVRDIRKHATSRYGSVDDTPAGGGPGMVMRADIVAAAIDAVDQAGRPLVLMSPRGRPFTQARARELSAGAGAIFVCGRFEGMDQRVIEGRALEELSIGDYILSGGELATMIVIDAVVRLLPGVIGASESLSEESFEKGLLEYPHYTRPQVWEGREIPEILTSGHHRKIRDWRLAQSLELTKSRRPDLWDAWQRRHGTAPTKH
jgi:tRNA (guanine37-N1)-methyltransferase